MPEQMSNLLNKIETLSEHLERQFDSMIALSESMQKAQKELISDIDKLQKATTTKPSHDRLE